DKRAIARALAPHDLGSVDLLLGKHAKGLRSPAKRTRSLEHVGEGMPFGLSRQGLAQSGWQPNIEIAGFGGDTLNRTAFAPKVAADNAHARAVVIDDLGDFGGLDVLIAR